MAFYETPRFPVCIAAGSRGGPGWLTDVVVVSSGKEQRNQRWSTVRHRYDVSYGIHTLDDIEQLVSFFHGVRGRVHGFRFKDYADYRSGSVLTSPSPTDQTIGTADGAETAFQLVKVYDYLANSYTRTIAKPVNGTVRVAVAGVEQLSGWTCDTTTGIVTFTSPPASGAVTAGFEFDVPCRFDTDTLSVQLELITAGGTEMPLVEIKL